MSNTNNHPYRTADKKPMPKFSFIERLYLSDSKLQRALMHTILIAHPMLKPAAAVGVILLAACAALAAVMAIGYALDKLLHLVVVEYHYMTHFQFSVALACAVAFCLAIVKAIVKIRECVQENNLQMQNQIKLAMNTSEE